MTTIDEYDDECPHGIFPASSCSFCNGRVQGERTANTTVVHWFEARYAGHVACGCTVRVGDRIGRVDDTTFVCEAHGAQ